MKPFRTLFEEYKLGLLNDSGIETLHQALVGLYFNNPDELNQEEFDYVEDLILESYLKHQLEAKYIDIIQSKLADDQIFKRKFNLYGKLEEGFKPTTKAFTLNPKTDIPVGEPDKEPALEKVLQGIIEKVHAEEDSVPEKEKSENVLNRIIYFFTELKQSINIHQLRLQPVLVFASVLFLAGIIWIYFQPEKTEMTAENIVMDSSKSISLKNPESEKLRINNEKKEFQDKVNKSPVTDRKQKKVIKKSVLPVESEALLAYAELPDNFEVYLTRSGSSSEIKDMYLTAAERYDLKDFDSCISILTNLYQLNFFKDKDTLNEMNFYLGNCYLANSFRKSDSEMYLLALESYARIEANSNYYDHGRWYSALALIKLGKKTDGLRILESLFQKDYLRAGKVEELKGYLIEN
ncbi:MAG: hypothetical protein V1775_03740 [Bacteroidota bacterium]